MSGFKVARECSQGFANVRKASLDFARLREVSGTCRLKVCPQLALVPHFRESSMRQRRVLLGERNFATQ